MPFRKNFFPCVYELRYDLTVVFFWYDCIKSLEDFFYHAHCPKAVREANETCVIRLFFQGYPLG